MTETTLLPQVPLPQVPPPQALPRWLVAELRSDHAGETGAVLIYQGILALSRDAGVRAFATRHQAAEQGHLDLLERLLPPRQRSLLLPAWRLAGWLTGALPALLGPRAVYATIDAVESFVDHHYRQQIERLHAERLLPDIAALLEHCRAEELHHRDEARDAAPGSRPLLLRLWCRVVGGGSAAAVTLARLL